MRADGNTYFWCYQKVRPSDGKRVEQPVRLGLVAAIGSDSAAWREVGRLTLIEKHILNPTQGQPTFGWLANHYIRDGLPFNKRNGKRKTKGTVYNYQHSLDDFILPRWENEVAAKIKPLAVRDWLYSVHDEQDYDWQTVTKIKMVMGQVSSHADIYGLETCRNPIQKMMIPGSEDTDREAMLALRDGEPYVAFGTPGGDQQDQWTLGFFLNHVHFGMNLQQAIDFPAFHSKHMPSSFYPREAYPAELDVEERVGEEVIGELGDRGHEVNVQAPWSLGRISAVARRGGMLYGAANPRGMQGYAAGR